LVNPHAGDFHRRAARDHVLGMRRRETAVHKLDHVVDGEAVRDHESFRASRVAAVSKEFEGANAVALGAAVAGHSSPLLSRCDRPHFTKTQLPFW
jgi:hypothetical protein